MTKEEICKQLKKFESSLKNNLSSNKEQIINQVKLHTPRNGEGEGYFTKLFLSKILKEVFSGKVTIEGIDSEGKTQFKEMFFGNKPAPDFVVGHPFNIVGEIKYCKLATRQIATAIGQALFYLAASQIESIRYQYGCVIYFSLSNTQYVLKKEEIKLIKELWGKENIFLIVI